MLVFSPGKKDHWLLEVDFKGIYVNKEPCSVVLARELYMDIDIFLIKQGISDSCETQLIVASNHYSREQP